MSSFRKRLLVLIIGLVVVTQTVTLAAVLASTAHHVESRAADELRSGGSFAQQLIQFRAGQLANGVGVLAADFGFREAVAGGDIPTIISAATNNAQRIGADMVLLTDTHGKVLASTAPGGKTKGFTLESLLAESHGQRDLPVFRVLADRTYQFFLAPVRTPETIAWVAMGFVVNDALAQKMRDVVGADVTLIAYRPDGPDRVASTLPEALRKTIATQRTPDNQPHVAHVADTDYLSFAQRIAGRGDVVDVVVQKSMHEVLAPYRDVRDALLLIDGIALVLAAIVGTVLGRSATRPIGELVRAAERIQEGRYDTAVVATGGAEFRSLAATFNTMQKNIAEREADITFQAQHDRLTGLPNRGFVEQRLEELLAHRPAVLRVECNTRTDMQLQAHFLELKAAANQAGHLIGVQRGALRRAIAGHQQELALTQAGHNVLRRRIGPQPPGRFLQHIIAHVMTERGVDFTDLAQINEHESGLVRGTEQLFQALFHEAPGWAGR